MHKKASMRARKRAEGPKLLVADPDRSTTTWIHVLGISMYTRQLDQLSQGLFSYYMFAQLALSFISYISQKVNFHWVFLETNNARVLCQN